MISKTLKKNIFFLFFLLVALTKAQTFEKYPNDVSFYKGGINGFNEDIRRVIKKNKLKPCENNEETYSASVLVNPDFKIQFVKDFDTLYINKNKCAYDFTKSVLPYLKDWIPLKKEGKKTSAIAVFTINPYFLFHHKYWNDEKNRPPVFEKDLKYFQDEVKQILESRIKENISGRGVYLSLVISDNGILENVIIHNLQLNEITERELKREILSIKGKWKPGLHNGIPIRHTINLIFKQEFSFDVEKQKLEDQEMKLRNRGF